MYWSKCTVRVRRIIAENDVRRRTLDVQRRVPAGQDGINIIWTRGRTVSIKRGADVNFAASWNRPCRTFRNPCKLLRAHTMLVRLCYIDCPSCRPRRTSARPYNFRNGVLPTAVGHVLASVSPAISICSRPSRRDYAGFGRLKTYVSRPYVFVGVLKF